jgi:pyruvate/2-oxoglutarate dehydrogenase complex dihydrolipoamide dehydrogenase (E3) component
VIHRPRLDSVDFWINCHAAIPTELPVSLAILGGGAIAWSADRPSARLGCSVNLIEAGPTLLGVEEPEAGAALKPHLEADGIMVTIRDPCNAVKQPMTGPPGNCANVVVHLKSGRRYAPTDCSSPPGGVRMWMRGGQLDSHKQSAVG